MGYPPGESGAAGAAGAFGTAKAKAVSLLALGYTRLELLGNELEGARISAMRQLVLLHGLLFCVALGAVLAVAALVLLWWEQRLLVVTLSSAVLWALALYFYWAMSRNTGQSEPLFAASLAELQEDLRQLKAASDQGHHGRHGHHEHHGQATD